MIFYWTYETSWTLRILSLRRLCLLEYLCAYLMVMRLHFLLGMLTAFWMILLVLVGVWWMFYYSSQAELGPPGGVTYSCPVSGVSE